MSNTVTPRLARGMRDLLPAKMLARQQMINTIKEVYELYGFVPIKTPAIERMKTLRGSAGEEAQKNIFEVENPDSYENPEEHRLGLRFDQTVPLARVVSQYSNLPRPFRRYQVSPVWRADEPEPGRYREFTQFDLDSVGVVSEVADTEIIAGMCDTLSALDVGSYRVRFSSREILNLLLKFADIEEERGPDVFRVLDKIERKGLKNVKKELMGGYVDESGDEIEGLELDEGQVNKIEEFLSITPYSSTGYENVKNRNDVLLALRDLFRSVGGANEEIDAVENISDHLYALGYEDDEVILDLSIARGLDYYTGPVFEAVLLDAPEFGSVFGGGRYDDLVKRFLGEKVPATGASIGVDRLLAALEELDKVSSRDSTAQVLVLNIDSELEEDYLDITYKLRRSGIPTEFYLGQEESISKQLKYADQCGVPIALLLGPKEKKRGNVTLKDLEVGKEKSEAIEEREEWIQERPGQREVPRSKLVDEVKKMIP